METSSIYSLCVATLRNLADRIAGSRNGAAH
jgi:hypothetical protein